MQIGGWTTYTPHTQYNDPMVRDAFGNDLNVGDKVIIAKNTRGGTSLVEGQLVQIRSFLNWKKEPVTRYQVQTGFSKSSLSNLKRVMKAPTRV